MSSDALATRAAESPLMTVVPPRIHKPNRRAVSLRKSWIGPSPSASATFSLSASFNPMKEKFSGRQAISAPKSLASRSNSAAAARLSSTTCPEVICIAATLPMLLRCLCSRRGGVCALDTFDRWIFPITGNPIIPPRQPLQRLLEHLREDQNGPADHRAGRKRRQGQRTADIAGNHCSLVIILVFQAHAPNQPDLRRRPLDEHVVGEGVAVPQIEVSADAVEGEPLVGQVAEIQGQAPRQGSHAGEAHHPPGARLEPRDLPLVERHLDGARGV